MLKKSGLSDNDVQKLQDKKEVKQEEKKS